MTRKQLPYVISFGVFLAALIGGFIYADTTTTAEAATKARHQPVVAPVPSGVDPSSPTVSSASPSDDVKPSTSTPVATTDDTGNKLAPK